MFDIGHYLSFDYIKKQQFIFESYRDQNLWFTMGVYFMIYILVTTMSLPGAAALTLLGGSLFGLMQGIILVSLASTCGATFAYLISRFLFRESIEKKFKNKFKTFNKGIEKEGLFYLFTLRLIPAFPFFIVNLLAGLTSIKIVPYALVSQIGMLPGTFVYVNAGTKLSQIDSTKDILSLPLLSSFILLGLFPFIIKFVVNQVKQKRGIQQ